MQLKVSLIKSSFNTSDDMQRFLYYYYDNVDFLRRCNLLIFFSCESRLHRTSEHLLATTSATKILLNSKVIAKCCANFQNQSTVHILQKGCVNFVNLLRKDLYRHRCFPLNFAKILKVH